MSTQFNFFGDLEGASRMIAEAEKKLSLLWDGGSVCLTEDEIDQLENQFRVFRSQLSKLKDRKDKFKAVALIRAESSK